MTQTEQPVISERVYTLTNAADGNAVVIYTRSSDGTLVPLGSPSPGLGFVPVPPVDTGGLGAGNLVPSQGALAFSDDRRYLFTVNPGSNDVSSFVVTPGGLRLSSKVASGGIEPRSLTVNGNLLYVVNGFGTGNIAGFTIGQGGILTPLEGSVQSLESAGSEPSTVSFSNDGELLVVTEIMATRITVFVLGQDGRPRARRSHPSSGPRPFGFAFNRNGHLIVSEASAIGAVSSYEIDRTGAITLISASVTSRQATSCWIVNTADGRYTYTANTASDSISGYRVSTSGKLVLLDADGRTALTGDTSIPLDMVISGDGRHLYVLSQSKQTVGAYRIESDGSLTLLPSVGVPASVAFGLAIG